MAIGSVRPVEEQFARESVAMRINSICYCLLGSLVAGCASIPDFTTSDPRAEGVAHVGKAGEESFDFEVKDLNEGPYGTIDRELLHEAIQAEVKEFAKPGARVSVTVGTGPQIIGTVRQRTRDHLELYNCIARIPVPGPDGQMQCQTTHTPLQSIPIQEMTRFGQIDPPPKNYHPPELTDEITAVGLIFRDGHQQQWARVRTPE